MGDLREELLRLAERWMRKIDLFRKHHAEDDSFIWLLACLAEVEDVLASHPAPSPSVSRDAALKAQGFEDVRPVGGCADAIGLAPSPRSEAEGPPKLIERNTSTEEGRQFWASAEQAAAGVESWPDWKRAGINEAESRARARSEAGGGPCCVDRARRGWCDCARAPVPAESATMPKCANPSHPFCDEAGAGGCYPCRACGGKTEISYPTADGLKWRPCPECTATQGEEDGR